MCTVPVQQEFNIKYKLCDSIECIRMYTTCIFLFINYTLNVVTYVYSKNTSFYVSSNMTMERALAIL